LFQLEELTEAVDTLVDRVNKLIKEDIPKLNKILKQYDLKPFKLPKEVKL